MSDENLSNLRRHDYDKYLALFFAPPDKKAQLAALFNFHYEISQIPVTVSEPMIGMIKFQWWRDCLEEMQAGKPPRPHPILRGLVHSNINYENLASVIDNYEKLLGQWQPHDFTELEEFINNTCCIIFGQAANILETTYAASTARAYAYNLLARKIATNARSILSFSGLIPGSVANPEVDPRVKTDDNESIVDILFKKSKQLWQPDNSAFAIITAYYNKNPTARRWRLILKLAFCKAFL